MQVILALLRRQKARLGWCTLAVLFGMTAGATSAFAQSSTAATVRGHVEDTSGAVLPGVTITLTNTGTKAPTTAVTDDRGQYLVQVFPGSYDLKAELSGFKTYEQKGLTLSQNDARGIDVKLEVGQQSETITVTAQSEIIQTETGAREGVLSAKQIDNLSVIGRSSLELMRILPGVVADFNVGEAVSFGGGANNTQGYTVNGIRSSGNTVQLDGSNLIDIGSNSGVIVTLNNDMVQEVKVQSSNFAAEFGAGGMNVSGVTKAGASKFHGEAYDYWRDSKFSANDRSNTITGTPKPKSKYNYPGGNFGGPLFFGDDYTKNHDKLFFFVGLEGQRQQVDSGSSYTRTFTVAEKQGDFSALLANHGSNLNSIPQLRIPQGYPGAGNPAPNNDMRPYMTAIGKYFASLYPDPNFSDPSNLYNYVYSQLEPQNRVDFKSRFDWNISNRTRAYVRVAHETETIESPRGVWWAPGDVVALPTPNVGDNIGRSYSGNIVSVLSSSMTNEALVSYSRLTLDNHFKDPSILLQGHDGITFQGIFPGASPYLPTDLLHGWGGNGQVGQLWAQGERHVRPQRLAPDQRQVDQADGHARHEVRRHARTRPEAAELPESRGRPVVVRLRQQYRHRQFSRRHARRPRRPVQPGHGRNRQPRSRSAVRRLPFLGHRRLRAGQLEGEIEPDAGIRRARRLLDEQPGAERPRRLLRPGALQQE